MSVETLLVVVAGALVICVAVVAFVMWRRLRSTGSAEARDLLQLEDLKVSMANREGALDARMAELDNKVGRLQESLTSREAALEQRIKGMGDDVRKVSGLFASDRERGGWGEISLMRVFELAGLVEGRDYTRQFDAGDRRPDAVVHLPGGANIVIDAKFPTARYSEALECEDLEARQELMAEQGRELERVGKSLADKGYAELASGGYVVMYLPSQAVFEAAASAHLPLIEKLMERRVIVAGPSSLYPIVMHAGMLVTEHRAIRQSHEVLDAAKELRGRLVTFVSHLQSLSKALGRTVASFNAAVGSWTSRVSPQLDRVNDMAGLEPVDGIDPIDEAVRSLEVEPASFGSSSLN
jgi:DNA recombination protein RmuC